MAVAIPTSRLMVKIKLFSLFFAVLMTALSAVAEDVGAENDKVNEKVSEKNGEKVAESTTNTVPSSKAAKYFEYYLLSIDHTQWLEKMNFQFAGFTDEDKANFSGLDLNLEQGTSYAWWGWSLGATFGSGKASGGGNSSIILYQRGNQAWTTYGGFGKLFYRVTPQISLGASIPVFIKNISWATSVSGLSVDSGKTINSGLLLEMNYRLTKKIDLYQSLGSLNFIEGSTIWKIGMGYRL